MQPAVWLQPNHHWCYTSTGWPAACPLLKGSGPWEPLGGTAFHVGDLLCSSWQLGTANRMQDCSSSWLLGRGRGCAVSQMLTESSGQVLAPGTKRDPPLWPPRPSLLLCFQMKLCWEVLFFSCKPPSSHLPVLPASGFSISRSLRGGGESAHILCPIAHMVQQRGGIPAQSKGLWESECV